MATACVVLLAVSLAGVRVAADFSYDRQLANSSELQKYKLKCQPGRTTITVRSQDQYPNRPNDYDYSDDYDSRVYRRTHTLSKPDDGETCIMCICAVSGKEQVCLKRPAKNVNECLIIVQAADRLSGGHRDKYSNPTYNHERLLSLMIRRSALNSLRSKLRRKREEEGIEKRILDYLLSIKKEEK